MMIHKRLREAGGKVVVHSVTPHVMELLEVLRFERVLYIAEDETAGLELLSHDRG